eukprot:SAG31_NODE_792_length_12047_cov_14.428607_9_plen_64_part_00
MDFAKRIMIDFRDSMAAILNRVDRVVDPDGVIHFGAPRRKKVKLEEMRGAQSRQLHVKRTIVH